MDLNDDIPWSTAPPGQYPYDSHAIDLPSLRYDPCQRSIASLLTSIGAFANKIFVSNLPDYSIVEIKRAGRVCNNVMIMDDYLHFFAEIFDEPTRPSTLVIHLDLLQPDEMRYFNRLLPNLPEYDDIIISTVSSTGKVFLLLILPPKSTINVYYVTPLQYHETNAQLRRVLELLSQAFGKSFSVYLRLQISIEFHPDPLFIALFLTAIIEKQGEYLKASENTLLRYKRWVLRDFVDLHDDFLGKLDVGKVTQYSYPFQTPRRPQDQYEKLEKKGWFVMDVEGDGNCGYYALLLGLQNVGNNEYFIDTSASSQRVAQNRWRHQVLALRQRLEAGSEELLSEVFPVGSPNRALEWWMTELGTFDTEQQNQLSGSFVIPNIDDIGPYFNGDFTEDVNMHHYHMNPYWSAVVIAYVFKVRVIIITRTSSPKLNATSETDVEHNHSTKIFEFDDDFESTKDSYVPVTNHDKCFRLNDASFHAKPTIELLYTTGYRSLGGGPDDNHFLFLRRILCVKIPPDLPISETSLRNFILQAQLPSQSTINAVAIETEAEPEQQSEHIQLENNYATSTVARSIPVEEDSERTSGDLPTGISDVEPSCESMQLDNAIAGTTEALTNQMEEGNTQPPGDLPTGNSDTEPSCEGMQLDNAIAGTTEALTDQMEEDNTQPPVDIPTTNHDTYDNLIYDANTEQYFIGHFNSKLKRFLKKTLVTDLNTIDSKLLEDAKKEPNVWVSLPLGDPCDDPPPANLITKVKCLYEQLDKPYCVTYCMASALFYCGFGDKAQDLASQASLLAPLHMKAQLECLKCFLPSLVPFIGGATIYGKRCAGNNKNKRPITWNDLFTDITPYPTLVVPTRQDNGKMTHAFCVVDDLIFDSCFSHALKLKMESVNWIFQDEPVDIFMALRFATKVSPMGHKVRGTYKRRVESNWNHDNKDHPKKHSAKKVVNKVYDIEYAPMPTFTRIG